MEYLIIILICIIIAIVLKFVWQIKIKDLKKIKEIGYDKELNKITNKLPANKEICSKILEKLNNKEVIIKEEENNTASLYIAISNTIIIANIKDTFTRVQTIAHECLHSIQNKTTLLFNFIFSNILLIYFLVICILGIINKLNTPMLHLFILTIMSFVYYAIRSYLEIDAMTKATFVAKEYMEENKNFTADEINIITDNNKVITELGIKLTLYKLLVSCLIKIVIFSLINIM